MIFSFRQAVQLFLITFILLCGIGMTDSKDQSMNLPKTIMGWNRSDKSQKVDSQTIFEYMDGAGELYIGYRFNHIDVYNYQSPNREDEILVELYHMKSSDDAFGLLSLDWTGDPVQLGCSLLPENEKTTSPDFRFLYGSGLLRIWSNNLYARILVFPETPASKEAVLEIGRAIVSGRENTSPPDFLNALPLSLAGRWHLERTRVHFLRTHLVLNSIYFLSFSNILDLDLSTKIAAGRYRIHSDSDESEFFQVFVVHYIDADKARRSLIRFRKAYFPEISIDHDRGVGLYKPQVYSTENKWSGFALHNRVLILGFDLPDASSGEMILNETVNHIKTMEDMHGWK